MADFGFRFVPFEPDCEQSQDWPTFEGLQRRKRLE